MISIHALREEGDSTASRASTDFSPFLSTPSARRATLDDDVARLGVGISIHALREEGDRSTSKVNRSVNYISIHALREEGDGRRAVSRHHHAAISIHALREEGDLAAAVNSRLMSIFLSTPSARRATRQRRTWCWSSFYFYPRPPRGGRRDRPASWHSCDRFLSTPSARRATRQIFHRAVGELISIHALREEGDLAAPGHDGLQFDFYPRPPRGGRRFPGLVGHLHVLFLSTPSARRATKSSFAALRHLVISIHALREEGDAPRLMAANSQYLFLSTPSARRATVAFMPAGERPNNFYPRPPRGGRRLP